jgi:hypothetical protein
MSVAEFGAVLEREVLDELVCACVLCSGFDGGFVVILNIARTNILRHA